MDSHRSVLPCLFAISHLGLPSEVRFAAIYSFRSKQRLTAFQVASGNGSIEFSINSKRPSVEMTSNTAFIAIPKMKPHSTNTATSEKVFQIENDE